MKTSMKNLLLSMAGAALLICTSCGNDDSSDTPQSSARLTVDGKVYEKASDSEIAFLEIEINGETSYSIGGDVVNGTDTVTFHWMFQVYPLLLTPKRQMEMMSRFTYPLQPSI